MIRKSGYRFSEKIMLKSAAAGGNLRERMFQLGERRFEIEKFTGHDTGPTTPRLNLTAPRGFERLRCVDIEKGAIPLDGDFRHRFIMFGNEMTGTDIAIERHQFVEEPARPQHGIAAPAVTDGDRN